MKQWVFDPRVGDAVESGNPALIAGRLLGDGGHPVDWKAIADAADIADEQVKFAAEILAKKAAEYAVAQFGHLFNSGTGEVRVSGGFYKPRTLQ